MGKLQYQSPQKRGNPPKRGVFVFAKPFGSICHSQPASDGQQKIKKISLDTQESVAKMSI
jgi:hypothetical protein